jgi:hydrogenase nickel incorporation protein HypA/HybF
MHELSVARNMISAIERNLAGKPEMKIKKIFIKVGEFSGVVPDTLRFAFQAAKADTVLEDSFLDIETVPFRARCRTCEKEFTMGEQFCYMCPFCASRDVEIIAGKELFIDSLEAEDK